MGLRPPARSQPTLGEINARLVLFDSGNRLVGPVGAPAPGFRDIAFRSDTGNYLLLQDTPGSAGGGAPTAPTPRAREAPEGAQNCILPCFEPCFEATPTC